MLPAPPFTPAIARCAARTRGPLLGRPRPSPRKGVGAFLLCFPLVKMGPRPPGLRSPRAPDRACGRRRGGRVRVSFACPSGGAVDSNEKPNKPRVRAVPGDGASHGNLVYFCKRAACTVSSFLLNTLFVLNSWSGGSCPPAGFDPGFGFRFLVFGFVFELHSHSVIPSPGLCFVRSGPWLSALPPSVAVSPFIPLMLRGHFRPLVLIPPSP